MANPEGFNKYVDPKKAHVVHEDMIEAIQNYDGTSDSIQRVFAARREKTKNGEPYHNGDHDAEYLETAQRLTMNYVMAGFKWPERPKKKG